MVRHRTVVTLLAAIVAIGCASPSATFISSDGRWMRCAAHGFGVLSSAVAYSSYEKCAESAKAMGMLQVATATDLGLKLAIEGPVRVESIETGSFAHVAGIWTGDLVIAINGVTVKNGIHANQLFMKPVGTVYAVMVERGSNRFPIAVMSR